MLGRGIHPGPSEAWALEPLSWYNQGQPGLKTVTIVPAIMNQLEGTSAECGTITVVFYEPYPMGLGGNFETQRLILERLNKSKIYPIVVSPVDGAALQRFRDLGVECVVIPAPAGVAGYGGTVLRAGLLSRLRAALDLLAYNRAVARFLRQRSVDVVYANCVRAELCVGFACRMTGVPSLLYVKGELANPLIDRLCLLLARRVLFFCAQNRDDKYKALMRLMRGKVEVLKIGLDPEVVDRVERADPATIRRELGLRDDCVNAAVLAQLYRPKGIHVAIEAMARLGPGGSRARLYLLGDHVIKEFEGYRPEVEALIARLGLSDRVKFMGWRTDALEIARSMDLVIHPSLAEGFGRAVLESMALGKPVIASAVGGLREAIIDGLNGYLVPPGDAEALARRWVELIGDPELRQRIGSAAKCTVYDEYLIDDKVARLAIIWTEMAAGASRRCVA